MGGWQPPKTRVVRHSGAPPKKRPRRGNGVPNAFGILLSGTDSGCGVTTLIIGALQEKTRVPDSQAAVPVIVSG